MCVWLDKDSPIEIIPFLEKFLKLKGKDDFPGRFLSEQSDF
jgi:hypothetical protein